MRFELLVENSLQQPVSRFRIPDFLLLGKVSPFVALVSNAPDLAFNQGNLSDDVRDLARPR